MARRNHDKANILLWRINEGRLKKNSFFFVSGKLRLDKTAFFHYIIKNQKKGPEAV